MMLKVLYDQLLRPLTRELDCLGEELQDRLYLNVDGQLVDRVLYTLWIPIQQQLIEDLEDEL